MVKAIREILRWTLLYFLPCYIGASLFFVVAMFALGDVDGIRQMWPVAAILNVPLAGLIGASMATPPKKRF